MKSCKHISISLLVISMIMTPLSINADEESVCDILCQAGINVSDIPKPKVSKEVYESNEASIEFHLHGPLCTALDKMGVYQLPEDINVGDWLVFSQVGAYGFTESMPYFLCHNLPAEVILLDGDLSILRDVQQSSDWLV